MCATYRDKERRSNFQSFANKILTGIKEIISDYAEKRAIWELFQNALDTIDTNGELQIIKTDLGFKFVHNGKAFKDEHIGGLIKQYSSGKAYGDNSKNIGQYGTGFLSTHVYGKKIIINSAVINDEGILKSLKDFKLNRTADNIELLTDDLICQDNLIADLCDSPGNEESSYSETSFEYEASENNKLSIDVMLHYIPDILPFIFCFNQKLSKVTINNGLEELVYFNPEFKIEKFTLKSSIKSPLELNYIENNNGSLKLIIPDKIIDIPKLFLFFPLMETSDFGINFLIHARDFKPNKERDYLYLNDKSEELVGEVQINKSLLSEAFSLIIDRIGKDEKIDFIPFCNIKFNDIDTEFLIGLKRKLINSIINLKRIILSDNEKSSIGDVVFFGNEILSFENEVQKAFYVIYSEFYILPNFEDYIFLSERVNEWGKFGVESLNIITLKELLVDISAKSLRDYSKIKNSDSYKILINAIKEDVSLLNSVAVIPNMHNRLLTYSVLRRWEVIEPYLVKSMVEINYPISESYLKDDFYFIDNIVPYNRENFKEDLNKLCNHLNDRLHKKDDIEIDLKKLINPLLYFINLNKITDLNVNLSIFFREALNVVLDSDKLESPTKDIIYHPAIKLLSRIYILEIINNSKDGLVSEYDIKNIYSLLDILNTNTNIKDELLDKFECIPNQNNFLKSQSNLKLDQIHDDNFKDKYHEIVGKDIRDDLANDAFNKFLQHQNSISGDELGKEIEIKLHPERKFIPIKDCVNEEVLRIILDLIKGISQNNATWSKWLPNINSVKEEVLMFKFQDEKTRNSLFSILSESEAKINLLGELSQIDDLEKLIKAGKEKQKEEARKNQHLEYIKKVGIEIQILIENQLNKDLSDVFELVESTTDNRLKNREEQNGQDFIIYKRDIHTNIEEAVYFIEVKSRWDIEGIVALSKRQIEKCAKNPDRYAVITVNVADYKSKNNLINENVTFDLLKDDIYVNTDLSDEFNNLIKENEKSETIPDNTKLIEFRGHIPQSRIKGNNSSSISFQEFIDNLKTILS